MSRLDQYDEWLTTDDAAAIVIREPLVPVEGPDGVFFPATYAAAEDKSFPGGYNIDPPTGEKNVCLVDSVGSAGEPHRAGLRQARLLTLGSAGHHPGRREVGEHAGCRAPRR